MRNRGIFSLGHLTTPELLFGQHCTTPSGEESNVLWWAGDIPLRKHVCSSPRMQETELTHSPASKDSFISVCPMSWWGQLFQMFVRINHVHLFMPQVTLIIVNGVYSQVNVVGLQPQSFQFLRGNVTIKLNFIQPLWGHQKPNRALDTAYSYPFNKISFQIFKLCIP